MNEGQTILIIVTSVIAVISFITLIIAVALLRRNKPNKAGANKVFDDEVTSADVMEVVTEEEQKTRDSVKTYVQGLKDSIFDGVQATNRQVLDNVRDLSDRTYQRTADIQAEVKTRLDENKITLAAELKAVREELQKSLDASRNNLNTCMKEIREETAGSIAETGKCLAEGLKEVRSDVGKSLDGLKEGLATALKEVREENSAKLNEIRGVVDEKLTITINTRLKESFEQVSKQLESVNKGLGEMQSLTNGMSDLKKVLGGVKTRGNWGEVSLEELLSDILAPSQYKRQFAVGQEANDGRKVDFAIVLPGLNDGEEVYLPVDSKFPLEDFATMQAAAENCDTLAFANSKNTLRATIKSFASSISNKYIQVPKTTDFAIMYLPIESLYAEVLRMDGLIEELQNKYRVIPAGPTNFTALLNSLKMGFKTVQIQKNSNELVKLLQAFNKDFGKFVDNLSIAQKQVATVQTTLKNATERSVIIQDKLRKVEKLGIEQGEEN